MRFKQVLKLIWDVLPLTFLINILARCFIVMAVLSYLSSLEVLNMMIKVVLFFWILLPCRSLFYDLYYLLKMNLFANQNKSGEKVK